MRRISLLSFLVCGPIVLHAPVGHAQENGSATGSSSASASLSLGGSGAQAQGSADASGSAKKEPWSQVVELGLFGGVMFPSSSHNLHKEERPHEPFKSVAPELGLRLAYFPLAFLGAEFEGAVMPTSTKDTDSSAGLHALRGHVIGQFPMSGWTPFAVLGGGSLGAGSNSMGTDRDPALHFGVGVKVPVDDFVSLRFDVRDTLAQKNDASAGSQTHYPEILGGLTFTIGKPSKKQAKDTDGDGVLDSDDKCPTVAADTETGCPPTDSDGDGVLDDKDACPTRAGKDPEGCPICPPADFDKDGVPDETDACPSQPGPAPQGCPEDADGDGLVGEADKCPDQPETKNGFHDSDGCPDEVPAAVKKFSGVIQGITFDTGTATIRAASKPTLDEAAKLLTDYKELKLVITGHTDNVGDHDKNVTLSAARADAVKKYLVDKGIAETRLETHGAGPDQPIADNNSDEGRQQNRRIEFKLADES